MLLVKKIILALLPLVAVVAVVYYLPAPASWPQASPIQILAFFIPMLLFFTFLSNILYSYLPHAFLTGLGCMFLLVLQTSNQLNIWTGALVILVTILVVRFFPKINYKFKLTRGSKIPKLTGTEKEK